MGLTTAFNDMRVSALICFNSRSSAIARAASSLNPAPAAVNVQDSPAMLELVGTAMISTVRLAVDDKTTR